MLALLLVDLMENSALIEQQQAEIARLRAAIEKYQKVASSLSSIGIDLGEEFWSALEPKP